jgi:rSAM/selenodomain-associated transferase 1
MTGRALLIMAKQPVPGQIKTRLTPPLSAQEAADLYTCLLRDTLDAVRTAVSLSYLAPYIAYHPAEAEADFRALAPDFHLLAQQGPDLSERLANALVAASALGYAQVTAVNSDSPGLPPEYLARAYEQLDDPTVDVVLGPTEDCGYYLIGWKRPFPDLVGHVQMSTPRVLDDTLALAAAAGLRVAMLPTWYDIDDAADLDRLRLDQRAGPHTRAFLAR